MMRNDVKLGLAVGGVLLAVLIVYVLVVPGGSEQGGAELATDGTPMNADGTPVTPADETVEQYAVVTTPTPAPRDGTNTTGNRANTAADPFATGRPADAAADGQRATANGTAGGWDWARLLNGDSAPALLSETDVPTGAAATPTTAMTPAPGAVATDTTGTVIPDGSSPLAGTGEPPSLVAPSAARTNVLVTEPARVETGASSLNGSTTAAGGVAAASQQQRTHLVQAGETFSSIALAAYGSSRYYAHIQRANPSLDPARLKPGTTIVIPALTDVRPDVSAPGSAASPRATVAAAQQRPIDPRTEYRVEANDSLYKIAVKLYGDGVRHAEIYELNKQLIGPDPARLKVGTVLKLPAPPTSHMSAASGR